MQFNSFRNVHLTLNPGDRVRTLQPIDAFPTGYFEPGETGTFLSWDEGDCMAHIRLDKHYPQLDEWNNVLQVVDWQLMNENPDEDGLDKVLEVINDR